MKIKDEASERIKRLRKAYLDDKVWISVERAKHYTESWKKTEAKGIPLDIRVALAMRHVFETMTHYVDPDDRIAGRWTEYLLGTPIDIERGLFNNVLQTELSKSSMIGYQVKSNAKFLSYMVKKHGPVQAYRNIANRGTVGAAMPNVGTTTMDEREINPYTIDPKYKKVLRKELLPYWANKTMADRVGSETEKADLFAGDMRAFAAALPKTTSKMYTFVSTGAVVGTYQGHLVLDHGQVVRRGLLAMKKDVERELENSGDLSQEERDFLKSIDIALDGVMIFANRLADKLEEELEKASEPKRKDVLATMLANCRQVPLHPAETFYEAVQSFWTLTVATELANETNVHAAGRLDQMFYPYYKNDVEQGRITREEARELLEEILLKIMTHNIRPESNFIGTFYHRYEGSAPVTLGGLTRDGKDATNELTYVFIEAADRARSAVNVVVRFHKNSPEDLYMAVADVLYRGCSSVSLMNDESLHRGDDAARFQQR